MRQTVAMNEVTTRTGANVATLTSVRRAVRAIGLVAAFPFLPIAPEVVAGLWLAELVLDMRHRSLTTAQ